GVPEGLRQCIGHHTLLGHTPPPCWIVLSTSWNVKRCASSARAHIFHIWTQRDRRYHNTMRKRVYMGSLHCSGEFGDHEDERSTCALSQRQRPPPGFENPM